MAESRGGIELCGPGIQGVGNYQRIRIGGLDLRIGERDEGGGGMKGRIRKSLERTARG